MPRARCYYTGVKHSWTTKPPGLLLPREHPSWAKGQLVNWAGHRPRPLKAEGMERGQPAALAGGQETDLPRQVGSSIQARRGACLPPPPEPAPP